MRRYSGGYSGLALQSQRGKDEAPNSVAAPHAAVAPPRPKEEGPNDEERARFGYSRRPSKSPRCASRPGETNSKTSTGPVDLVALVEKTFEESESLKNLLRMKLIAGKFDYKGRISELTDLNEDLKSALSQQLAGAKEWRDSVAVIQENINTRLSLAAEELVAQRALTQRLSSELAVVRQQVGAQEELQHALHTARREREQAIAECAQRLDSCQALCKREVAEAADACQRQLDGVAHLHARVTDAEAKVEALTKAREDQTQEHALLLRDHAMISGEASASREAKRELQAQLAEKKRCLEQREEKVQQLQVQLVDTEGFLKQKQSDCQMLRAHLNDRDERLSEAANDLQAARASLHETKSLLEQREADVHALHDRIRQEEGQCAEISDLQTRVLQAEGLASQRGDEITSLSSLLQEKQNLLVQKDSQLVQSEIDVRALKTKCDEKDGRLQDLQDLLAKKEDSIRQHDREVRTLKAQLVEIEASSEQRLSNVQMLEQRLRETDETLRRKDDDLRESIRSMQQIHSDSNALVNTERQRTQNLERQLQALQESERELKLGSQASEKLVEQFKAEAHAREQAQQQLEAERDELAETAARSQASLRTREEELTYAASGLRAAHAELAQAQSALVEKTRELDAAMQERSRLQLQFSSYKEHHGVSNQEQMGAITDLKLTVDRLSKQVEVKQMELSAQQGNAGMQREYAQMLEQRLAFAERDRRELHNAVQELKGNIRVFCRVRPVLDGTEQALEVHDGDKLTLTYGGEPYNFGYDKVFDPMVTQKDVFDEVSGLVQSALDGYKVCIFAYGQTGSGKTFTMQGTEKGESWGLIPRSLSKIFENSRVMCSQGWSWSLKASFFEVYNESFRDLLQQGGCAGASPLVHVIKHDEAWGTVVTNMTAVEVDTMEQVRDLTVKAAKQRSVGATDSNSVSSRSHAVFALYLKGANHKLNTEHHGALHLVDLAGSERLNKSGSTGDRLKETQNINRSLSSLADVFLAKTERRSHVPFRNSKLTHLMEPCLSGQGKTLMLVNVCADDSNAHETLCSLRFASQVNQCNTGGKARRTIKPIVDSTSSSRPHSVVRMQSARRMSNPG